MNLFKTLNNHEDEINILILGETGTGKSTTLNALANYLKYSSFEEACEAQELFNLIPSTFSLPNPETDDDDQQISSGNSDENEHSGDDGSSCTQSPVSYVFKFQDKILRIIDTPGIGDTSGISKDKENFEKIFHFLKHHKELHGICILLKANENRKTALFRYCITELLTHLHRSACRNIVFFFTHSRNTFYEPGDGFMTLKKFLRNELKSVELELKRNVNCFFIDNEAYRFLVAIKQGYPFPSHQLRLYKESWEKSSRQIQRMIEIVCQLEPHQMESTVALNNARKLLLKMAEPLVQLQANIDQNIARIGDEEEKLNTLKQQQPTSKSLGKKLNLEIWDLEMRALDYPTTVCTAQKCVEVLETNGQHKVHYKTQCHEECFLDEVEVNLIGDSRLKKCWAFSLGASENCDQNCGCPWQKHMHVSCEFVKVKRNIVIEQEINNTTSSSAKPNSVEVTLSAMRKLGDELKKEFEIIQNISTKFAIILSTNSNTPINRYIEPYLDLLIEEEQSKINSVLNYPRKALNSLMEMKRKHQEMVHILIEAIDKGGSSNKSSVSIADVAKYRDQLIKLKHTGPQFKQMIETQIECRQQQFEYREKLAMELGGNH